MSEWYNKGESSGSESNRGSYAGGSYDIKRYSGENYSGEKSIAAKFTVEYGGTYNIVVQKRYENGENLSHSESSSNGKSSNDTERFNSKSYRETYGSVSSGEVVK